MFSCLVTKFVAQKSYSKSWFMWNFLFHLKLILVPELKQQYKLSIYVIQPIVARSMFSVHYEYTQLSYKFVTKLDFKKY